MAIVNSYVSLPEGTGFPNSMLHSKDQVPPLKQLTHRASAFQTLSGLKKKKLGTLKFLHPMSGPKLYKKNTSWTSQMGMGQNPGT